MSDLIKITSENGTPVVSSREVAENFGKRHSDVLKAIEQHISELASTDAEVRWFISSDYSDKKGEQRKEYQITRDGFSLLVMSFNNTRDVLEWKLKYIEAFNQMEQQLAAPTQALSPQLQVLINLELQQKEQAKAIADTNARLDGICEVVALNPTAWREDAKRLISKIALKWGGYEYIKEVVAEVYRLVDARAGANLAMRLENKRRRLADEGVCKSKREKISKVDVIADDKRLIEIYLAIVKEMAVQNGIGQKTA